MGDMRFREAYDKVRNAPNRMAALRRLSDEEVVAALAWASREADPVFANVLATEAMNRMGRGRQVIQHMSEGVITLDRDGHVLTVNPAAERVLDSLQEEIVGKPLGDVLAFPEMGISWVLAPLQGGIESVRPGVGIQTSRGRRLVADVAVIPIIIDGEVTGEIVELRVLSWSSVREEGASRGA